MNKQEKIDAWTLFHSLFKEGEEVWLITDEDDFIWGELLEFNDEECADNSQASQSNSSSITLLYLSSHAVLRNDASVGKAILSLIFILTPLPQTSLPLHQILKPQ